jgi:hypothetical protein
MEKDMSPKTEVDTQVRFYDIESTSTKKPSHVILDTGSKTRKLDGRADKKASTGGAGTGTGAEPTPTEPGAGTRTFYNLIFEANSKQEQPLCKDIFDQTGAWSSGKCDQAAAYTVWTLTFSDNLSAVYSPTGDKTPLTYKVTSSVTLPEWQHTFGEETDADDRAEILRVSMRTAHHESGHRRCPEEVTAAVQRFWDALPTTVPRHEVAAMNNAVYRTVREFYQHLGRNIADSEYDKISRHGYIQGAIFNKRVDKEGDDRTVFVADTEALVSALVQGMSPKQKRKPNVPRRRQRHAKCGIKGCST